MNMMVRPASRSSSVLRCFTLTVLLLLGLALAGNQRSFAAGEDRSPLVKIRVTNHDLAPGLTSQGGELIADYGGFQLWRAPAAAAAAIAPQESVEVLSGEDVIELHAGPIDTSALPKPSAPATENFSGKRLHLVQFAGPIKPEWHAALLAQGLRVVSYVPRNAYLVYGDSKALAAFRAAALNAPHVQWEGPYEAAHKIHPLAQAAAQKALQQMPVEDLFAIQLVEDQESNVDSLQFLQQIRRQVLRQSPSLGYVNLVLRLPPERLSDIASLPDVVSIQVYAEPKKRDERQGQILAGNLTAGVPNGPGYLAWLASKGLTIEGFTASGFGVDVSDSGIDNGTTSPNHPGLHVLGNAAQPSRVLYNRLIGTPHSGSTLQACDGHGNLNSHIICGYNDLSGFPHTDSQGYHYGLGIAPFVRVGSSVIFDPDTFTYPSYPELQSRAYQDGARVSCNSWGANVGGAYNFDCQSYDALVRDAQPAGSPFPTAGNQQMVIVFAAGNAGSSPNTVGSPGTAKNIISVGAAENVHSHSTTNGGNSTTGTDGCGITDVQADNANDIIMFSSRGPCDDGRIKPDLMGPGTHVTGGVGQQASPGSLGTALSCFVASGVCALPGAGTPGNANNFFPLGQQFYTTSSGTSHSCPAIGGGAALLRQFFINQNWTPPSPAMTKAWLMNSSRYMTGASANDTLPSNNQGMGMMNLGTAFDGVPRVRRDQLAEDRFTATGQTRTFQGVASDSSRPFRVTLAWTDAPGSTTGNAYNNNLDLTLSIGGLTYRGNVFSGAVSVPGGVADIRNNVESIFLPAGSSGQFTVTVTAANINSDGVPGNTDLLDQDFALVIYNSSDHAVDLLPGTARILSESCSPGQGAIDPGETVTVEFALRNIGPSNTTDLVATLLATNGIVSPDGPHTYGVIPANGGSVTQAFTFTAAGACGGAIAAVLQLQDGTNDYGNVQFPFTLGQLSNRSLAQTNDTAVSISATDGSVAPYPSPISVSGLAGAISKVTVSLHGLSHSWPDDLDVLLVGPQGQSVMLFSSAGGGIDVTNLELTLDDAASSGLAQGGPLTSGTWRPSNYSTNALLPAPAPSGNYGSRLSIFGGANPNGLWQLFIADHYPSDDGGMLSGGWSLNLTTTNRECCYDPTMVDLALAVQADPNPVGLSNNIVYTLTVTNNGPALATDVMVTNLLPNEALFVSVTGSQGTLINQSNTVTWSVGALAPGQGASAQIVATVLSGPVLTDWAIVQCGQTDLNPLNNESVSTVTVNVPFLSIEDVSVIEGDTGARPAVFVLTLSQPAVVPVSVDFYTVGVTATSGVDFLPQTNRVQFAPGDIFQTIEIPVLGDVINEDDETFRLVLSNPVNAALLRSEAIGTIIDDDPMPAISVGDAAVLEGQTGTTNLAFPVTLSAPSGRWITVSCTTSNGTATAGSDFQAVANQKLTLAPGTIATNLNVVVFGDTQIEPNETLFLQLSSPSNAVLGRSLGVGTILTDDIAPLVSLTSYRLTAESQSPPDGAIDAGETVTLSVAFRNTGSADTTNLVITLLATNGVVDPGAPQNFGVLVAGGVQVSRPFTFTAGAPNCSTMQMLFQLQDGALNLGTQTLTVPIGNCLADDFEPDIDLSQWAAFGGTLGSTVLATNYGGSISGTHSLWFGDNGSRFATTRPINTSVGGTVQFYLRLANGSSAPWEIVDLPGEGVVLEYSTNGSGFWIEMGRYDTTVYYSWTAITSDIPVAAQAPFTQFRWRQLAHSGSCCDHWAIDDVLVYCQPRPPIILAQPASQCARPGASATFCATAVGSMPLTYQWQKNGTNLVDGGTISGAATSCLTLSSVVDDDSGIYNVLLTNPYGQTNSAPATLLVSYVDHFVWSPIASPQTRTVPFPASITARDNLNNLVSNFNFCASLGGLAATTNTVGTGTTTAFYPIGTGYHDERTQVIYQPAEIGSTGRITSLSLDVATIPAQIMNNWTIRMKHTPLSSYSSYLWEGSGWTVLFQTNFSLTRTGWVTFNFTAPFDYNGVDNLMIDFSFNNSSYSSDGYCRGTTRSTTRTLYYRTDSAYGDPLGWSGSTPSAYATTFTPNLRLQFNSGGTLLMDPTVACFTNGTWTGALTLQTKGSNLVLRVDDGLGHSGLSNPFDVISTNDPPTIITQPADQLVVASNAVTLAVAAAGTPPLTYQWQFFSTNLPGATSSRLAWSSVSTSDTGPYDVVVTNAFGSITSSIANVTVLAGPIGRVGVYGAEMSYVYNNDVSNKLSRWTFIGGVDSRLVSSGYPVPTLAELLQYPAVLVYADYSFNNSVALGNVLADYVDAGGGVVLATFSFFSSGGIAGRIQTGGYLPVTQASSTSGSGLTLVADLPAHPILQGVNSFNGGLYSFHNYPISPSSGAVLVAHWNDGQPLVATKQPAAGRVVALNFYPPSDAVSSGYWLSTTDGGRLMANALLWASQGASSFTNPFVLTQPVSQTVLPGTNVTLCVRAAGARPLNYQWQKDGTNLVDGVRISGASSQCLSISNVVENDTGDYQVLISNSYGITNSIPAALVVSTLDHFAWDPVTSPQLQGAPFGVVLTAQDVANRPVTNYQRCVSLSSSGLVRSNTIGNGQSTVIFPLATGSTVARSQIIYRPTELGTSGFVTALGLNISTLPGPMNNWTVRLKHTPLSSYSSYLWETTGWTVVCQTNLTVSQTGWVTIPFTTPFYYNGVDNLMVDFSFSNTSSSFYGYCWASAPGGTRSIYYYTSGTYGDPLGWSGSYPSPYSSSYAPDLRLLLTTSTSVAMQPGGACFTNGVWTGSVTVQGKATNLVLIADDLLGHANSSNPFNVAGTNDPPVILSQPADQLVLAGNPVAVSVGASGTPPLAYQWQFFSTNLPGATNSTLAWSTVSTKDTGPYDVVVTNAFGSITSSIASLTVLAGPIGRIGLYAAETSYVYNNDVSNKLSRSAFISGVDTRLVSSGYPVPTLTELLQYPAVLVYLDGSFNNPVALGNVLADYIDAGGGVVLATFSFSSSGGISGRIQTGGYLPVTLASSSSGSSLSLVPDLPAHPILQGVNSFNGGLSSYHNYSISTNTGAALVAHWSDGQPLVATKQPAAGRVAALNFFPPSDTVLSGGWRSTTDGARLMANALLWASQGASSFTNPFVLTQPVSQNVRPGTNVTLCVRAAGARPLNYQWQKDGTNLVDGGRIIGVSSQCLSISNVLESDTGDYQVLISNSYGTTNSIPAALVVSTLDHFAWDPIASPQLQGMPFGVVLTAQDEANRPVTNYQRCVALSSGGVVTTNSTGRGDTTMEFPMTTGYNVARTQIIYRSAELGTNGFITALSLNVSTLPGQTMNNWTIRLKHTPLISYSSSIWESTGWTVVCQTNLTVSQTGWLSFTLSAPFYYNGVDNLMIDFSFNNTSSSSYGYCWSTQLGGGTRTVYYFTSGSYGDPLAWSGTYPGIYGAGYVPDLRVLFSSSTAEAMQPGAACFTNGVWTGSVTVQGKATNLVLIADDLMGHANSSNPFNVAGSNEPPVILSQPADQLVLAGSNVAVPVGASGTPSLAYQWQFFSTNLPGATGSTLSLTSISVSQAGPYSVVVTNSFGSTTSSVATLTVLAAPLGRVAVYGPATSYSYNNDVSNKLSRSVFITDVDSRFISSGYPVPTLAELLQYPAVLVYSDGSFNNPVALGNVLADYIDAGGGVVLATFSFYSSGGIAGRIQTGGYLPITLGNYATGSFLTLLKDLPAHPILQGVNSFNGGLNSYHNFPISTNIGAALVAHWSDGQPLVATKQPAEGRVVALNFFPPSDTITSSGWCSTTDGARLMANALLWASQGASCFTNPFVITQPVSQAVRPGTNVTLCVLAAGARPLNYQWQKDGTNLVDGGRISGASSQCLSISNAAETDSGEYQVLVSNSYGTTNSVPAALVVSTLDHFAWAPVASPQLKGVPFGVILTAQDAANQPVTNYQRCVALSSGGVVKTNSIGMAQTTIEFPMATGSSVARSQIIYRSTELGTNGFVTALALYVSGLPGQTMNNWTIRLKHTPLSSYSSYLWETTGWTVCQTNLTVAQPGWVTIPFTNPFYYNGVDNLMVDLSFSNTLASSYGYCWASALGGTRSVFYYTSTSYGDPLGWSGTYPSPYVSAYAPDLRLLFSTSTAVAITPTTACFTNGIWAGSVTVQGKATNLVLIADDLMGHANPSNPFNVRGTNDPPIIITPPANQFAIIGGTAAFMVKAEGTAPLSYQWRFFSTNLPGATSSTLSLSGISPIQSGPYAVVVTNPFGSATSSVATLTVLASSLGRVAVYGAETSFVYNNDVSNSLSRSVLITGVDTRLVSSGYPVPPLAELMQYPAVMVYADYAFNDPIAFGNVLADYVDAGGGVVLNAFSFNSSSGIAGRLQTGGYLPVTQGNLGSGVNLDLVADLPAHPILQGISSFNGGSGSYHNAPISLNSGATLVAHWSNGQPLVATKQSGAGSVVALNFYPPSDAVNSSYWRSSTDGAHLMANALLFAAQGSTTNTSPVILVQPGSRTVAIGRTSSFRVRAGGIAPLSYQWRKGGMPLNAATESALTITNVQLTDAGSYDVIVTNSYGSVTSAVAVLTAVNLPPSADFQIGSLLTSNSRVVEHDPVTGDDRGGIAVSFSEVLYSGDSSTARFALETLSGGTPLGIIFDALVSDLQSGEIYSLGNGSTPLTPSGGAVTTLLQHDGDTGLFNGSVITLSSPVSLAANGGNVGIFAGYGRVVLHNGSHVYSISLPSGQVSDLGAMATPSHAYTENWAYWGVAENWDGQTYLVYVRDPQTIVRTSVPSNNTTVLNSFTNLSDMACFTVSPLHARWYFHFEGSSQFGGSSETLGYADAVLNIQTPCTNCAPDILVQPAGATLLAGSPAFFQVTVSGTPPLSYLWYFNGTAIAGATNAAYSIPSAQSSDSGLYHVVVSNPYGSTVSADALLRVSPPGMTVLAQGNLIVTITNPAARIYSLQFQGGEVYRVGTFISDWGLQTGTNDSTFVVNMNNNDFTGQPMALLSAGGLSATYAGNYNTGQANVALTRTYDLMPGSDVLRIIQSFRNDGAAPIVLRGFDTFDPDYATPTNTWWSMEADRYSITNNGLRVQIGRGILGSVVLLVGTPDPQAVVSDCAAYFGISSPAALDFMFSTGGFDPDGAMLDGTIDIGREFALSPGESATFIFYQSFANSVPSAETALWSSITSTNTALRLGVAPQTGNTFELLVGSADGTPVSTERAARIRVYASTNMSLGSTYWTTLANPLVLTNGLLRMDGLTVTNTPARFFRAVEFTFPPGP